MRPTISPAQAPAWRHADWGKHPAFAKRNGTSCVYVITDQTRQYTKIGIASDPRRRLSNLQVASPLALVLHFVTDSMARGEAAAIERKVHARLRDKHTSGEWFAIDPDSAADLVRELLDG